MNIKQKALLPIEERRSAVFPETLAAMTAFLKMPGRQKGNYASVDIGAGTTDVALFWFHKTDGDPQACYYSAASYAVGMDDIDAAIAEVSPRSDQHVREAREQLGADTVNQYADHFRPVIDAIYAHYRRTWGQAYENCPGEGQWVQEVNGRRTAQFTLCLVGGGAKFAPIEQRLIEPFKNALRMDDIPYEIPSVPARLKMIFRRRVAEVPDRCDRYRSLLLLAYGLSEHAVDIPRYEPNATFFRVTRVHLAISNPSSEDENSSYIFL